ncbi:hypothetical protein M514_03151 [Trichuris suis]|uniref:RRM domain-containing protein n=1 Tax=Trichuris suis TaxID=68888 RepID=A0A085N931_9BILA|nr:hypothetical protein M514_03151 [Trichuris suis]
MMRRIEASMDTVSDNGVAVVGALDTSSSVELMDAPAVQTEGGAPTANNAVDAEMEEIRARMREMEEEAAILRQYHSEVENQMNLTNASTADITMEDKAEADGRSIYVGNVDYGATAEELESHFHGCGVVNRVTILCNKYTGQPKGFAYIEFGDKESMRNSLAMDDTFFRGRQIKVMAKRTNRPGLSTTNRFPRSRGRPRVIIKYVYGGSRRPRGYSRRRNFYAHF